MQHVNQGEDIMKLHTRKLTQHLPVRARAGFLSIRAGLSAVLLSIALGLGLSPVYADDAAQDATVSTVNINSANAEALASALNGVGYSRAEDIVRYRKQYGPFGSVDDLTEVKGIGKSTLEKNRARITLE